MSELRSERVEALQAEYAQLVEELRDINDAASAAGRTSLTEEETRKWDDIECRAKAIARALKIEAMSSDPQVRNQARDAYNSREFVFRLTPARAESGKRFREYLTRGALEADGGVRIELRDATTPTVSTDVTGAIPIFTQDFIEPLEKGIIYGLVGLKIKTGLSGQSKYPIAPYIEATMEDETVKLPDTTIKLESLTPRPKRVGITAALTGTANMLTDGAVYNWIVNELVKAVARYLNRWMFQALPIKDGVHGVFSYDAATNNIKQKTFAGALPTYKELLEMRGEVMSTGAYNDGTYAYVVSGLMHATLEGERRFSSGERTIIESGKVGDIPVFTTEEIEATAKGTYNAKPKHVGFGRFSDVMAHQFGDMNLIIDPFSDSKKGITNVTLQTHWAVDVIRKGSFVIGTVGA